MQAKYELLTREIVEITAQLDLARERTVQAERQCQQLEDTLDQPEPHPSEDKHSADSTFIT